MTNIIRQISFAGDVRATVPAATKRTPPQATGQAESSRVFWLPARRVPMNCRAVGKRTGFESSATKGFQTDSWAAHDRSMAIKFLWWNLRLAPKRPPDFSMHESCCSSWITWISKIERPTKSKCQTEGFHRASMIEKCVVWNAFEVLWNSFEVPFTFKDYRFNSLITNKLLGSNLLFDIDYSTGLPLWSLQPIFPSRWLVQAVKHNRRTQILNLSLSCQNVSAGSYRPRKKPGSSRKEFRPIGLAMPGHWNSSFEIHPND